MQGVSSKAEHTAAKSRARAHSAHPHCLSQSGVLLIVCTKRQQNCQSASSLYKDFGKAHFHFLHMAGPPSLFQFHPKDPNPRTLAVTKCFQAGIWITCRQSLTTSSLFPSKPSGYFLSAGIWFGPGLVFTGILTDETDMSPT